jgi:hypothetical protein
MAKRKGSENRYLPATATKSANVIEPKIRDFLKMFLIFFDLELTNHVKKR